MQTHERPPYKADEIDKANAHLESLIRVVRRSSSQEEIRLRAENDRIRPALVDLVKYAEGMNPVPPAIWRAIQALK